MKARLLTPLFLSLLLFLLSCKKDLSDDKIFPVITLDRPIDGDTLFTYQLVKFEMDLSDNEELFTCKVKIYHSMSDNEHQNHGGEPWLYTSTIDIANIKIARIHNHEIMVPDSVNGKAVALGSYYFNVTCIDKAGNVSVVSRHVILAAGTPHGDH